VPTSPPPLPPAPRRPSPFGPVTIEAEALTNRIAGSAWVDSYPGASGGSIVRNIGNWDRKSPLGTLTFNVTVPAAGTYTLVFFYVHLDDEPDRTAVISVAGQATISVDVVGSATCCASRSVTVTLRKGANAITFGNPDGHAPSLDKIVIRAG